LHPLLASLAILFVFVENPFNTPVKLHAALKPVAIGPT
jgi:hypothetical protein